MAGNFELTFRLEYKLHKIGQFESPLPTANSKGQRREGSTLSWQIAGESKVPAGQALLVLRPRKLGGKGVCPIGTSLEGSGRERKGGWCGGGSTLLPRKCEALSLRQCLPGFY